MLGSFFCLKQTIRWFSFVFYLRLDPSQGRITRAHAKIWHRNCAQFSLCLTPWRAMAACGMPRASFKRLFWVQVAMVAMVIATLFFGWVDDRWGQKVPLAGSLLVKFAHFALWNKKHVSCYSQPRRTHDLCENLMYHGLLGCAPRKVYNSWSPHMHIQGQGNIMIVSQLLAGMQPPIQVCQ